MKTAFSLSDAVSDQLPIISKIVSNGNASLLADLALTRLLALPVDELKGLVSRHNLDRQAATRNGWMNAYWTVLGEEMGQRDQIDNPYAPRNFGDFYAVLLLNHVGRYDDEGDPFIPYFGPRVAHPKGSAPRQWIFDRSTSPVKAAEIVAAALRDAAELGGG